MSSRMTALTTLTSIAVFAITEYYFPNKGWVVAPLFFIATQRHSNSFVFKIFAFFLLVFQITSGWLEKKLLSYGAFAIHAGMLLIFCLFWIPNSSLAKKQPKIPSELIVDPLSSVSFEDKVRLCYRIYNPSKLPDIPELLEKYKDKETALLDRLGKKYGPITEKVIEEKLRQFYAVHNPSKLPDILAVLEKYKGRENALFDKLEMKYKAPLVSNTEVKRKSDAISDTSIYCSPSKGRQLELNPIVRRAQNAAMAAKQERQRKAVEMLLKKK